MAVDDEQLIKIETKLAHQEDLLTTLDDALSKQQLQISGLQQLCQSLVERIRALSEEGGSGGGQGDSEVPPHY
jgi:SlyX protein